jgi:hypothetical protein
MAKHVYNIRVEANEYEPLEYLLDKAGYESDLLETYDGDGEDIFARGIDAIRVYLVRQTQPSADYHQQTLYVCSSKEEAQRRARELNKQYGEGCKFSEDYDFEDIDWNNYCYDDVHYYDVESMVIDRPMA